MNMDKPYTFDRVFRLAMGAGLIFGLVKVLDYLSDVLIPFAVAVLIAYLVNPLVVVIQRKIPNRVAAVFISLGIVIVVVVGLIAVIVPVVSAEISHTGRLVKELLGSSELARKAGEKLPPDIHAAVKSLLAQKNVREFLQSSDAMSVGKSVAQKTLPGLWSLLSNTTNFVIGFFGLSVVILYVIFLLFDYQLIKSGWKELLPPAYAEQIVEFVRSFNDGMSRYFRAQAAVAGICGILFAVGFSIIGLPLGILLGLFVGLLNMVPYLQVIGLIPALGFGVVQALEVGGNIWFHLGLVGVVFVVVQVIQDTVLVPKIMGKVTGLSPAMILLSLSVWGKVLGMLGLLIALPMTCLLLAYYQRFIKDQPTVV